ncbi:MAG: hypothetical protein HY719_16645 [Planctomycetes bacterium]|nr:hypothetical protein [Planctomycetota bacterium]
MALSRDEVCPGERFTATVTFDQPVKGDIMSRLVIDRDLLGEKVDMLSSYVAGETVVFDMKMTSWFGGGPRTLRFTCGTSSAQREFMKVGFASAVLRDSHDAGNVADVLAGQFSITTFLGGWGSAWVKLDVTTEPAGHEENFLFAFKPTNGVMPPDGAFQPAGVNVSFSEAGSFEIAAKCVRDETPFMFGEGPRVNIVDLVSLTLRDLSTGREEVITRGTPSRMLVVTPGTLVEARVATNPAGHEAEVSFALIEPGETYMVTHILDRGSFLAGGVRPFVAPFSPVLLLAFFDKDANQAFTGGGGAVADVDPAVGGAFSPARRFDVLEVYLDGEKYRGDRGRHKVWRGGRQVVATGRAIWLGPNGGYSGNGFDIDDVDCGPVALSAMESEFCVVHEPDDEEPPASDTPGAATLFTLTPNPADGSIGLLAVNAGSAMVEFSAIDVESNELRGRFVYFQETHSVVVSLAPRVHVSPPVITSGGDLECRVEVTAAARDESAEVTIESGVAEIRVAFFDMADTAEVTAVHIDGVAVAYQSRRYMVGSYHTPCYEIAVRLSLPAATGMGKSTISIPLALTLSDRPPDESVDVRVPKVSIVARRVERPTEAK